MKENIILTAATTIALAVGSGPAMASTLPPADTGAAYASMNGLPDDMTLFPARGFPPASATADMMMLPVTGNTGMGYGRTDHVPPVNPPIDTPAFPYGLVNMPPRMMPAVIPPGTLPGIDFGQVVVPVPAAVWLFGSGLLGLIGMARRRKQ